MEQSSRIHIENAQRITFSINPDNKRKIIPEEWKGNIDAIMQEELLKANRNFANKKDILIQGVAAEVAKPLDVFYTDLVERWKWHNEFYESILEPAIPLILEKNHLDLSPFQVETLKKTYEVSALVDLATLISTAAIKKRLQVWIDQSQHLSQEEMFNVITPGKESFWAQYYIDHLNYILACKRDGEDKDKLRNLLLQKYHVGDISIFEGRLREFSRFNSWNEEEIQHEIDKLTISETHKVAHFYQTLERPDQKMVAKITEFDNIEEYDLLKNLVGISGFVLRKKILAYLADSKILPNNGSIYEFDDEEILDSLDRLRAYRTSYFEKKVDHFPQSSNESCSAACAVMALSYYGKADLNRENEMDLFENSRSKYTTGSLYSALASELIQKGMEVSLLHSEDGSFKYDNTLFNKKTYDSVLQEYMDRLPNDPNFIIESGVKIDSEKLKELLKNNNQVILAGIIGTSALHSVLVSGYTEDGFVVHDPIRNKKEFWSARQIDRFAKTPIGSWLIALQPQRGPLNDLEESLASFKERAKYILKLKKKGGGKV